MGKVCYGHLPCTYNETLFIFSITSSGIGVATAKIQQLLLPFIIENLDIIIIYNNNNNGDDNDR